jgi:hypothetical protein
MTGDKVAIEARHNSVTLAALYIDISAIPLADTWTAGVAQDYCTRIS